LSPSGTPSISGTYPPTSSFSPSSQFSIAPTCYRYYFEDTIDLGKACNYAIIAKSGISTVPNSIITGDIAVSPIASGALTGFSLTMDPSNQFATSTQVTGQLLASDYAVPTPARLTEAVYDLEAAYRDAFGRATTRENNGPAIGGQTFYPGVYTYAAGISIGTDITFDGGPDDVLIIKTAAGMTVTAGVQVHLSGCAQAKNIFWQITSSVYIGANAQLLGTLLVKEKAVFGANSSIIGSVLAQTAVTLDQTTITQNTGTCSSAD
jgi:hypothetical protein